MKGHLFLFLPFDPCVSFEGDYDLLKDLNMNLNRVAIFLTRCWTSFLDIGSSMSNIVLIFFKLSLIVFC